MANEPIQAKLILLDRNTYEAWKDAGTLSNTGLYIVREENSATNNMLTFCVGEGTQTEIMDITQNLQHDDVELSFDDQNNTYNLPQAYQIKGKLWFVQQTGADRDVYHVFMWNGERFLDCFGEPNNLAVVAELPDVGITNNAYILRGDSENILYVFDGTDYRVVGDVLRPDNITIKFNSQNQIKGVGAFGMDATIGGTTHTAQAGSEIFNYIDNGQHNNIATGASSSASGIGTIATGDYSDAHNVGGHDAVTLPPYADGRQVSRVPGGYDSQPNHRGEGYEGTKGFANTAFGVSNSTHSDTNYCCFMTGAFNDIRYNSEFFNVMGYNIRMIDDELADTDTGFMSYFTLIGSELRLYCGGYSEGVYALANGCNISGNNIKNCYIFGSGHYLGDHGTDAYNNPWISNYMENNYLFGKEHKLYCQDSTSDYKTENNFIFGYHNTIAGGDYAVNPCGKFLMGNHLTYSLSRGTGSTDYSSLLVGSYNMQGNRPGPKNPPGIYSDGWKTLDMNATNQFQVACGTAVTPEDWMDKDLPNTELYCLTSHGVVNGYDNGFTGETGYTSYNRYLSDCACRGLTRSGDFQACDGTTLRPLQFKISLTSLGVSNPSVHDPIFDEFPENTSEYTFEETIHSIILQGYMDEMCIDTGNPHNTPCWLPYNQTGIPAPLPQQFARHCGVVDGYSCVLMFRPTADATLENLIKIVPGTGTDTRVQTNLYIMNPDFDLTSVTVVHAFLYLDGFRNMCIIYSGYNEGA